MIEVDTPDGVAEFPDGTAPEVMKAALQKRYGAPKPAAPPPAQAKPDSFGSRLASGLADPVMGAAQIADRLLVDPIRQAVSPGASSMKDVIRARDDEYKAPEGVDWARMAGNVINPMSWAGGSGGVRAGASMLPRAMNALAPSAAKAGALQGVLAPTAADDDMTDFALKKGGQAALGGTLGRVLGGAATPDARELIKQGVRVTPGEAAGGLANSMEQKLTSLPITGSIIEKGRRRAQEDVQGKLIERQTGMSGMTNVRDANKAVSGKYEVSVPHMKPNDAGYNNALDALEAAKLNPELNAADYTKLEKVFDKHFANYDQLDGRGLKKLDSELGFIGRKYSGHNASPSDQTFADEVYNIMHGLRSGLEVGMPPDAARTLNEANRGFRGMIPVNKAASARADELATPRALQKALARQARTDVTRMPRDPLIDPAVSTLTSTVPDSGTAGRQAAMSIPGVVMGGLAALPTAAAYSPLGRRMLSGTLMPGQEYLSPAMIAALRE